MQILNVNILTAVNLLLYSRIMISLICGFVFMYFCLEGDFHINCFLDGMIGMGLILLAAVAGTFGANLLSKIIIQRSKYPMVLSILCNILGLSKLKHQENSKFNLKDIIRDNKLRLTLYYINNPQYPILTFNRNKIIYFTQEYDWETFKWRHKIILNGKQEKSVLEFEGINQNNAKIKGSIDFEKIDKRDNEILLLFIIHDLLFGKRSCIYY